MPPPDLQSLTPQELRARRTLKWARYPADVVPMWVAEMDYPAAEPVQEAIGEAVRRQTYGYPSAEAIAELAQATAHWLGAAYRWQVDAGAVHVLGDVMQGVRLAIEAFGSPGDAVVVPSPVYMPFFDVVRIAGRRDVSVPMAWDGRRWTFDVDGIDRALGAGARIVVLCSPHNPLGRVFDRAELLALAEVVQRHGARVVSDEIHGPLAFGAPHTPYAALSPQTAAHTLTVLSASKAWNLPGLRCAQVVTGDPAIAQLWERIPFWSTVGVSTMGIEASIAAYRDGGAWLAAVNATLARNAALVARAIDAMPGVRTVPNEGTYLQWLDFTELGLDVEPADWLLGHAAVALSPGPPFGAQAHRFARLNYATTDAVLADGLERIDRAVRRRQG